MFNWFWQWTTAPLNVPTVPGLEYTQSVNKLHFTQPNNLLHYTLPNSKLHYTHKDDD